VSVSLIESISRDLEPILKFLLIGIAKEHLGLEYISQASDLLIDSSNKYSSLLKEAKHSILSSTLGDAGLGLWARLEEIKGRGYNSEDSLYFTEIYEVLRSIKVSIDTGEYEAELAKLKKPNLK